MRIVLRQTFHKMYQEADVMRELTGLSVSTSARRQRRKRKKFISSGKPTLFLHQRLLLLTAVHHPAILLLACSTGGLYLVENTAYVTFSRRSQSGKAKVALSQYSR